MLAAFLLDVDPSELPFAAAMGGVFCIFLAGVGVEDLPVRPVGVTRTFAPADVGWEGPDVMVRIILYPRCTERLSMATYYKHSGKFAPQGPILGLLAGIAASVPAAFLYDYAIFSIPSAKARALCTMVFGLLLGGACGAMMCLGKVRSKPLSGIIGLASSFIGLYVSWLAWILHLIYPSHWVFNVIPAALQPLRVWKTILAVNLHGTWSFEGGAPTHGVALWFVWASEALLVLGFGVLGAVALVMKRPFCERCEQWCVKQCKLYFAPALQPEEFKAQLESGDVSKLEKLPFGNKKQANYQIDLHTCNVCHQVNTLSLEQNLPRNHKTLVNKLMITAEQASIIRNIEMNQRATSGASAIPAPTK